MNRHAWLRRMKACEGGIEYVLEHRTNQQAWDACTRPDWMVWYYIHSVGAEPESRRMLMRVLLTCFRHLYPLCAAYPQPMLHALTCLARCKKRGRRSQELSRKAKFLSNWGLEHATNAFTRVLFSTAEHHTCSEAAFSSGLLFDYTRHKDTFPRVERKLLLELRRLIPVCPPMKVSRG